MSKSEHIQVFYRNKDELAAFCKQTEKDLHYRRFSPQNIDKLSRAKTGEE